MRGFPVAGHMGRTMAFDLDKGFSLGSIDFPWGTTIDAVADDLRIPRDEGRGTRWRRIETACGPTFGLDTIGAELTAHGGDRPVTALKYELAAVPDIRVPDPAIWLDPLMAAFGAPAEVSHHEVPESHAEGSVRFYANWPHGDQSVGLSLYGAPRSVEHGTSAGCLWLNWSVEAAARPFLAEWRARAGALVAETEHHSGILTFRTAEFQTSGLSQPGASRDSLHALFAPQLLPTPGTITRLLGPKAFAFWRSRDHARWYASTNWDTIAFEMGRPPTIDVHDVKPAKGGGYAEIGVDGWRVRDVYGSAAIANAVAALRTIPGVSLREIGGYDC